MRRHPGSLGRPRTPGVPTGFPAQALASPPEAPGAPYRRLAGTVRVSRTTNYKADDQSARDEMLEPNVGVWRDVRPRFHLSTSINPTAGDQGETAAVELCHSLPVVRAGGAKCVERRQLLNLPSGRHEVAQLPGARAHFVTPELGEGRRK